MTYPTHEELDAYEQGANDATYKMLGALILWYEQGLDHGKAQVLKDALSRMQAFDRLKDGKS